MNPNHNNINWPPTALNGNLNFPPMLPHPLQRMQVTFELPLPVMLYNAGAPFPPIPGLPPWPFMMPFYNELPFLPVPSLEQLQLLPPTLLAHNMPIESPLALPTIGAGAASLMARFEDLPASRRHHNVQRPSPIWPAPATRNPRPAPRYSSRSSSGPARTDSLPRLDAELLLTAHMMEPAMRQHIDVESLHKDTPPPPYGL